MELEDMKTDGDLLGVCSKELVQHRLGISCRISERSRLKSAKMEKDMVMMMMSE